MRGYRKVLVAVNGSLDVLKKGIELAQDEKTWVTVLKVIPSYDGDLNLTGIKNIGDVLDSGAEQALSGIAAAAKAEGALIKTRLEEGDVPRTIVDVAAEERCDLIILGAKQKKSWYERLLGDHVIEKVIQQAPCPVFIVGV
ncbi:MAG: universal stress protein [Nitrospirota bacterium]|nr:universal stress protein [Nitrospirota bacterium]